MRTLLLILALMLTIPAFAGDKQKAQYHFTLAAQLYRAGQYRAAIAEFESAYALFPTPLIQFNIARAHAKLGEDRRAIEKYRVYLQLAPKAADRAEIEAEIARLSARIAPHETAKPPPAREPPKPVVTKPPAPLAVKLAAAPPPRSSAPLWGAGIGALLVGGGIAVSRISAAQALAPFGGSAGTVHMSSANYAAAAATANAARNWNLAADIGIAAGSLITLGSGVAWLRAVSVVPAPGGAFAAITFVR